MIEQQPDTPQARVDVAMGALYRVQDAADELAGAASGVDHAVDNVIDALAFTVFAVSDPNHRDTHDAWLDAARGESVVIEAGAENCEKLAQDVSAILPSVRAAMYVGVGAESDAILDAVIPQLADTACDSKDGFVHELAQAIWHINRAIDMLREMSGQMLAEVGVQEEKAETGR